MILEAVLIAFCVLMVVLFAIRVVGIGLKFCWEMAPIVAPLILIAGVLWLTGQLGSCNGADNNNNNQQTVEGHQ